MKYSILIVSLLLITLSAFAAIYQTQIHSLDVGKNGQPHLILLNDGHVAFLESGQKDNKEMLRAIKRSLKNKEWVEVRLDKELNLVSIQTISPEENGLSSGAEEDYDREKHSEYIPTVTSYSYASRIFRSMRRDYQNDSQCYNRAHIWTFEEWQRSNLNSMKLFLFFTSKYIRAYRYHWWFHVTPMVYVDGNSQAHWRALDRRYTRAPLTTQNWTNIFMHNDATCKVVNKYYDYRNHQQAEWCYLIPVSMYFWQPRDIERRDRNGFEKTNYINSEVNHAYWEAF
jgi:hypothetical protein